MTNEVIGWVATAVFSSSYFIRPPTRMLRVQAAAAGLWIAYGLAIGSVPIAVANLIVTVSALYGALRIKA